jgi:hypothetical protein
VDKPITIAPTIGETKTESRKPSQKLFPLLTPHRPMTTLGSSQSKSITRKIKASVVDIENPMTVLLGAYLLPVCLAADSWFLSVT